VGPAITSNIVWDDDEPDIGFGLLSLAGLYNRIREHTDGPIDPLMAVIQIQKFSDLVLGQFVTN